MIYYFLVFLIGFVVGMKAYKPLMLWAEVNRMVMNLSKMSAFEERKEEKPIKPRQ